MISRTRSAIAAKALIEIGGEPMLGRVARALLACPSVGRIVVLAQQPGDLLRGKLGWMADEPRIGTRASGDGISLQHPEHRRWRDRALAGAHRDGGPRAADPGNGRAFPRRGPRPGCRSRRRRTQGGRGSLSANAPHLAAIQRRRLYRRQSVRAAHADARERDWKSGRRSRGTARRRGGCSAISVRCSRSAR